MSSKIPWTRLFADKWILDLTYLSSIEGNIYMRLRLQMLHTGEPLLNNIKVWANYTGYSVKAFVKALDVLQSTGHIIRLADGRLWNLDVEAELSDSAGKSEAASKAVSARWKKSKEKDVKHNTKSIQAKYEGDTNSIRNEYESDTETIPYNINNNIYNKKTNTIVLAKKETDFEDLETTDLVEESIEVDALKSQSEQIETSSENQPPIHEQTSVPKKAKRSKANRECFLPDDFKPNLQYAIDKGLTHDEALLEFERFKLHWQNNPNRNAKKSDWQKAWYKWITHQEYGLLAKKREKLEREKRYANERYKQPANNFSSNLAESFSDLKAAIYAGDTYGSECSRNTETISSFERTCKEGGPELVSSDLYERKAVDAGGRSANFARL